MSSQDLKNELSVSHMSIIRYLNELERENFLKREHGGAVIIDRELSETDFQNRVDLHKEDKKIIAKRASKFFEGAKNIYIDSGTTCLYLLEYLPKDINIYTNSIALAFKVTDYSLDNNIHLLGGNIKASTKAIIDLDNFEFLEKIKFDVSFIGANAISSNGNLTTPDHKEGLIKKIVSFNSKKVVVVADSNKYNKSDFYDFTPKKYFLVTDKKIDIRNKNLNIEVIYED